MSDLREPVDLTNCDREPIHQLGAIQPFGFLLAVSLDWMVTRASTNLSEFLGVEQADALGRPVSSLILPEAVHTIRNKLTTIRSSDVVERIFDIALLPDQSRFDLAVHLQENLVILEGERCQQDKRNAPSLSMRSMMSRLDQTETLEAFFREGARQARALTGFDRVMVYRFDEGGSGEVVAEAARSGIGSFLGLHYPASDIPVQARALYLRNLFRIIADVDAMPVPVLPQLDEQGQPLDLSMSVLRSVSPIHIEYLKNMGVGASLSISIVVDGKLWGLFACHHYGPRLPSAQIRSTAELFGQMFASRLESRERRLALDYETKARRIADRLLTSVADNASLLDDPAWLIEALADAVPADGIGVWINGRIALAGTGPDEKAFAALVRHLNRNAGGRIYAVDRLGETYLEIDHGAAGMLAIPISRSPRDYVVLFRQELVRTVRWGGDPHKPVEYGPNGPRLTPRKSFEAWSELVRGRSLPFTEAERRVAETIRVTLIEVVLRLTDEASMARQMANERQELLIAELNHRVRNILSLITGIIRQSQTTSVSLGDYIRQLEGRIQSLARAHDQITRDHWAPASLRQLLSAETAAYLGKNAQRFRMSGEDVLLDPQAFSTAALVFHELMTNSAKYGSLSGAGSGTVELDWHRDDEGNLRIGWREKDGPPVADPKRHGFGSTIIRRSIPYDLGGKAEVRYMKEGLEADFFIPVRYVNAVGSSPLPDVAPAGAAQSAAASVNGEPLSGLKILLVENNLIIAMDGEDILRRLGAEVTTVPSVAEAMEILADQSFDFALLDVNLGDETSFGIADRLAADGVPFVFATGYGEGIAQANSHSDAPVLQKPYTTEGITDFLARVQLPKRG
ncbi:GAF domain-containing protein [Rhizobium bangladeshense]|uniref:HWE histidine kinase domain-containing protein n=1 Tax=Rhizobium bangladeshense TaxID=1138189 RepID=UPI001C916493|nr:HWE histidine kinase domain-containing protein [Rhizobium bangladeshense]MBY3584450.1 GAF domain-containing protein [Rhizobium bangladeshense]